MQTRRNNVNKIEVGDCVHIKEKDISAKVLRVSHGRLQVQYFISETKKVIIWQSISEVEKVEVIKY